MKKVDELYKTAKEGFGYSKRHIYNYVIIQSQLAGLDEKKVIKYLNKKLKEDGA